MRPPRRNEPNRRPAPRPAGAPSPTGSYDAAKGWDHVSTWYDGLVGEGQQDHFSETILPGLLRMLPTPLPKRVFDLACGQGYVSEALAQRGCEVVGLDAAAGLIAAAEQRLRTRGEAGRRARFVTGDARALESVLTNAKVGGSFDAALCIMAVMNIDPIDGMFAQLAARLAPGGTLLMVMLHPAFRAPAKSGWMWRDSIAQGSVQLRTVESYLTPFGSEIVMNPGQVARGECRSGRGAPQRHRFAVEHRQRVPGGAVDRQHRGTHRRWRARDRGHELGDDQPLVPGRHQQHHVAPRQGVHVAQRHLGATDEGGVQGIGQCGPRQRSMDLGSIEDTHGGRQYGGQGGAAVGRPTAGQALVAPAALRCGTPTRLRAL